MFNGNSGCTNLWSTVKKLGITEVMSASIRSDYDLENPFVLKSFY